MNPAPASARIRFAMSTFARLLALILALPLSGLAVEPGGAAPTLSMPRMDDSGKSVTLASLRGKVVYVDFWASWCIPCRISLPTLDRLARENGPKGFEVVGVNKDVRRDDADRFLARVPVSFILVADSSDAAAKAFGVKTMPSGYLVDRKGVVRYVHGGFTRSTADALTQEVAQLLAEKP
jgi:cytochrome c biogenesis protein CcmG/thiol:disulfide interchange protein DsbE